jgi:hypothetical protein
VTKRIPFNKNIRLIISDVDQTVADLYRDVTPGMARALTELLREGRALVLISGQGIDGIVRRVVRHLSSDVRRRVFIGHCSGAEVFGFDYAGALSGEPLYSLYRDIRPEMRDAWRRVIRSLIEEFRFRTFPTMEIPVFQAASRGDPLAIMLDDRGAQITFDMPNSHELPIKLAQELNVPYTGGQDTFDLREPVMRRAAELLRAGDLPISARLAGEFAIDFALAGVSKTTAVRRLLEHPDLYGVLGCTMNELDPVEHVEVWGDKFSIQRGGTDRHMSEALPPEVRSIDFRDEDPDEFPEGFNIAVWDGQYRLEAGLQEFLYSRSG